jgi:hypothetical protein
MTPERRAQLLLVYFTPWVLDGSMERPPHVVHAQQLQAAGDDGQRKSWQEGLNAYLKRVPEPGNLPDHAEFHFGFFCAVSGRQWRG